MMPTSLQSVAICKDPFNFMFHDTSAYDMISTLPIKIRILPVIIPQLKIESPFLLPCHPWWFNSFRQTVCNVGKPWFFLYCQQLLIKKSLIDWYYFSFNFCIFIQSR